MTTNYGIPGTIGYSMKASEQEGKDAWLGGCEEGENPYPPFDAISHLFWSLGWLKADAQSKERTPQNNTPAQSDGNSGSHSAHAPDVPDSQESRKKGT